MRSYTKYFVAINCQMGIIIEGIHNFVCLQSLFQFACVHVISNRCKLGDAKFGYLLIVALTALQSVARGLIFI